MTDKKLRIVILGLIAFFAILPLFFSFPYRVNIYLSWEGAYRMYSGQMPFKDFGIPMGYGFWIVPALFFKLFGPFMSSLIKAQVLINLMSGLAFWQLIKVFKFNRIIQLLAVLVYCLSYSFFNFWPWYNHSVIVYEFIALAFLLTAILEKNKYNYIYLGLSALFAFLSFFTKQDGGSLGILIAAFLLIVDYIYSRNFKNLLIFTLCFVAVASVFIVPLLSHDFSYWFNMGQEPHNSRLALKDFIDIIFGESMWLKFYILLLGFSLIYKLQDYRSFIKDKALVFYYLLTLGIFVEALLFQVTSYTPPDNNIFFHSFGFTFLITQVVPQIDFKKLKNFIPALFLILLWWSGTYWKYIDRVIKRAIPSYGETEGDKISVKTFMLKNQDNNIGMDQWVFSGLKSFEKVYMPDSTVEGMKKILNLQIIKNNQNPKVLNMTELTPLANEIPYELEKGLPLWYHEGVSMFPEQTALFVERVNAGYYDLILFETIPYLNNFFPEDVRQAAIRNYTKVDRFLAPRRPTDSHIEVYIKNEGFE